MVGGRAGLRRPRGDRRRRPLRRRVAGGRRGRARNRGPHSTNATACGVGGVDGPLDPRRRARSAGATARRPRPDPPAIVGAGTIRPMPHSLSGLAESAMQARVLTGLRDDGPLSRTELGDRLGAVADDDRRRGRPAHRDRPGPRDRPAPPVVGAARRWSTSPRTSGSWASRSGRPASWWGDRRPPRRPAPASTSPPTSRRGPTMVLEVARRHAVRRLMRGLRRRAAAGGRRGRARPGRLRAGLPVAPPLMPGWDGYPVRDTVARELGCPAVLDNDVNVMAVGERHAGVARQARDFLFVKIGTGIGCGVVVDGDLYRGVNGCAGDIGHMQVRGDGRRCVCGNLDCLKAYAGGAALAEDATAAALGGRSAVLAELLTAQGHLTAEDIGTAVARGDLEAATLLRESGQRVGQVVAALVSFFNPGMIVHRGTRQQPGSRAARRDPRDGLPAVPPAGHRQPPDRAERAPGVRRRHRRRPPGQLDGLRGRLVLTRPTCAIRFRKSVSRLTLSRPVSTFGVTAITSPPRCGAWEVPVVLGKAFTARSNYVERRLSGVLAALAAGSVTLSARRRRRPHLPGGRSPRPRRPPGPGAGRPVPEGHPQRPAGRADGPRRAARRRRAAHHAGGRRLAQRRRDRGQLDRRPHPGLQARRGGAAGHRPRPRLRRREEPLGLPLLLAAARHPGRRPGDRLDQRGRRARSTGTKADFAPYKGVIRVSRFKLVNDKLKLGSEHRIIDVPVDRGICCHVGGDIDFDSKGNLILSTGDDTNPFESDGYVPLDERPDRNPAFDAQRTAANTNDLRGKMLRIKPGKPAATPSPPATSSARARPRPGPRSTRWACATRSASRSTRAPTSCRWATTRRTRRRRTPPAARTARASGCRSRSPANYGWPYCATDELPYVDYDFATETSGEPFNCAAPRNTSPNNTGLVEAAAGREARDRLRLTASRSSSPSSAPAASAPMAGPAYQYDVRKTRKTAGRVARAVRRHAAALRVDP